MTAIIKREENNTACTFIYQNEAYHNEKNAYIYQGEKKKKIYMLGTYYAS